MNKPSPIGATRGSSSPATKRVEPQTGGAAAPNASTVITADARKVSGLQFLDALGLSSPEQREARRQENRERCIRKIVNGWSLHGEPQALVAECREIIAERECGDLLPPEGWELAERSALGMSK